MAATHTHKQTNQRMCARQKGSTCSLSRGSFWMSTLAHTQGERNPARSQQHDNTMSKKSRGSKKGTTFFSWGGLCLQSEEFVPDLKKENRTAANDRMNVKSTAVQRTHTACVCMYVHPISVHRHLRVCAPEEGEDGRLPSLPR